MNALVDQFSAARELRNRAPLLIVSGAAAMPVTAANEHHRPEHTAPENFPCLETSRVIPVVVTDADKKTPFSCECIEFIQLLRIDGARLLDKDMFAMPDRLHHNRRKRGIYDCHDHDSDIFRRESLVDGISSKASHSVRNRLCTLDLRVARDRDAAGRKPLEPFLSDQPAPDQSDTWIHLSSIFC